MWGTPRGPKLSSISEKDFPQHDDHPVGYPHDQLEPPLSLHPFQPGARSALLGRQEAEVGLQNLGQGFWSGSLAQPSGGMEIWTQWDLKMIHGS